MRLPRLAPALVGAVLLLTACGATGDASEHGLSVVASTNVYADIAATVAGGNVEVTAIIDDPSADPHSFEASVRTELAVSEADVVIENGGGYDDFMQTLLDATDSTAPVITAVEESAAAQAAGDELNEHVWYDVPTVAALAEEVAGALGDADPANAGTYTANAAAFTAQLDDLVAAEQAAAATTRDAGVLVTEPVPGYLLDALGADDRTPAAFSAAIEEGGAVSPAVLRDTLGLLTGGQVRAVVYNAQTTGPATEQVLAAARQAGVAVVPVTETLPEGQHYVSWMRGNLDAVAAALAT
ncbi:zinc/manganese transport system substrate-binding protein [Modestobacter sp. DSM 44400]|uniref:metal ABC transporter solute-binding protein, Zn/Mn family n=1 Tax=Modestobacter sp. DSM 44400 TaxID=1550230 RepID=UPI00089BFF43|nr:zinc ABC transporter substrate-binding protein [Modestobacter sp. DSM 44400]SDY88595.1 zinc/manganese transport system substrate-binding protein [Modestobacter sp. DSM 44400]